MLMVDNTATQNVYVQQSHKNWPIVISYVKKVRSTKHIDFSL